MFSVKTTASTTVTFRLKCLFMEGFNGLFLSTGQLAIDEMQCSFLQKCPAKEGDSLITPERASIPVARDSNNLPFCVGTIISPPVVTTVTASAIANKIVSLPVLTSTEALSEHMKYGCIPFASLARLLQKRIDIPYPLCPACPYSYKSKRSIVKSVSSENRPVVNFGLWGSDYKGPLPTTSIGP